MSQSITFSPSFLKMTEMQWQKTIEQSLKQFKWTFYHTRYSLGSEAGYPDLTCFHHEFGQMWIEVKTEAKSSVLSPNQHRWIAQIQDSGARCFVIRPRHWDVFTQIVQGVTDDKLEQIVDREVWLEVRNIKGIRR